jgi:uncharacterized protein (DUF1015 family)
VVPRFEPFTGLRYDVARVGALGDVCCPPYDAIDRRLHRELLARSPYNMVRLELPDEPDAPGATSNYERARAVLDAWRDDGVLARDPQPAFYGYRTTTTSSGGPGRPAAPGRATTGVIGALGLESSATGILPHEWTTSSATTDRQRLLEVLQLNVSPIWGLTPSCGLSDTIGSPPSSGLPTPAAPNPAGPNPGVPNKDLAELSVDGVVHQLWPITDPERCAAIGDLVSSQALILADGHHRYETALGYYQARAEAGAGPDDGSSALMTYVVELADEEVQVQAIHRLVDKAVDVPALLAVLARSFTLTPTSPPSNGIEGRLEAAGAMAVVTATGTWLAAPSAQTTAAASHDLDASRLDAALASVPDIELRTRPGWRDVTEAVASGRASVGFLLRPPSVAQIAAISQGGSRMPAKTTYFWPKPQTGLVLRELDSS